VLKMSLLLAVVPGIYGWVSLGIFVCFFRSKLPEIIRAKPMAANDGWHAFCFKAHGTSRVTYLSDFISEIPCAEYVSSGL